MINETLKEKLEKGRVVVGTWCELPSPEVVNVLAKAGLDFVIIDMEHGPMNFSVASHMIIAAEVENCSPIVRVPRNDESDILRSLEISPSGIMVPHIESLEDRIKAVKSVKFPPIGKRSLNPYTRAGGYNPSSEFIQKENEKIFLSLIIESKKGINNISKIINDDNVQMIYLGTYDISVALGLGGDVKNRIVIETLKKLVKIITKKKKIVGTMFHDIDEFNFFKDLGIQFLCYKVDTAVIFDEFYTLIKSVH